MNVLVLLAFLSSVVAQSSFKIHHRIFHPSLQPFPYTERGTLIITGHSATFQPSPSIPNDFAAFFDLLQSLESPEHALYQVALGNAGDDQWDFSSVKVVRLIILSRRHDRSPRLVSAIFIQCPRIPFIYIFLTICPPNHSLWTTLSPRRLTMDHAHNWPSGKEKARQ